MASATCQLSEDHFLCSICLDVFTEPVTIPCGHNFCKGCINQHISTNTDWTCPICNESFNSKFELRVNRFISEMATLFRQSQDKDNDSLEFEALIAPISEEVPCDQCAEPKQNAVKSCLVCLASYCESHLEPHFDMIGLRRHQLIEPQGNLEDRVCKLHDKLLESYCIDDQVCVCVVCMCSIHKGHNVVPLKDAFEEHQQKLKELKTQVQETIKERKLKILFLHHSMETSNEVAENEIARSVDIFGTMKESMEKALDDLITEMTERTTNAEFLAGEMIQMLEQDIELLRKRGSALKRGLLMDDHLHLLQNFSEMTDKIPAKYGDVIIEIDPVYRGILMRTLAKLEVDVAKKMKQVFEAELNIAKTVQKDVTVDPETAHSEIYVSRDGRDISPKYNRSYVTTVPSSVKRFEDDRFVLGCEGFSKTFYFETAVGGKSEWTIGVAKESIDRKGLVKKDPENGFWAIRLENKSYFASPDLPIATRYKPNKVGVLADFDEGIVSFFDAEAPVLIYSFTGYTFKENLYPIFDPGPGYSNGYNYTSMLLMGK